MEILNKPINNFSFDDISNFCKQGYIEGYQLDYKKEISPKGLAKHFAAFSNTRGGVIIIGVEEDKKNGKPLVWEGIKDEGKIIDRIHQYASDVEPIPIYEVHQTNDKKGKVFILIHIHEGDRTPYYVQNDSNLWVRTGSISKPIDIASPDHIELLFGKKNKAEIVRNNYINKAYEIYDFALLRAEKERNRLIIIEKDKFERNKEQEIKNKGSTTLEYESDYVQSILGTQASMFTIIAMPFYPRKSLISPLNLLDSLEKIKIRSKFGEEFPSFGMELIPEGLLKFYWRYYDGMIKCEQIYSNGLIFHSVDVLRPDNQGYLNISISRIASILIIFLKAMKNFYYFTNYQGGISGFIELKDVTDVLIKRIYSDRIDIWGENKKSLLSKYKWDLNLDTVILNNDLNIQEYIIDKIKEIYWSFGYRPENEKIYEDYLRDAGWLIE